MKDFHRKLIGELVGLARATDGNEHLITPQTTSTILECLAANPSSEEDLQHYLHRVEAVKKDMVPDCFLCANPCGRTSAFDLSQIDREAQDIREVKNSILSILYTFPEMELSREQELLLYRGLIAIGMEEYTAEELQSAFITGSV